MLGELSVASPQPVSDGPQLLSIAHSQEENKTFFDPHWRRQVFKAIENLKSGSGLLFEPLADTLSIETS